MKQSGRMVLRALVEGAIMVALAQVLSYLKIWRMPWGGSVTLVMLPIVLYAVRWGIGSGLLAGFVLGVLQFMLDGGIVLGWQSILGDYVVAYTAVGLAGLFKRQKSGVFTGSLVGGLARFIVLWVTGATLWAQYMPESFLGMKMTSPWIYSALYQICYIGPSILISMVVFAALYKPMKKYFTGSDLKQ